jgi:hypothetical protein
MLHSTVGLKNRLLAGTEANTVFVFSKNGPAEVQCYELFTEPVSLPEFILEGL